MPRFPVHACCLLICFISCAAAQPDKSDDSVREDLQQHQYDLSTGGKVFLLNEARNASFFLLGELHGENEIPALLRELWPAMWKDGYRHIAAELSPWAANHLNSSLQTASPGSGLSGRSRKPFSFTRWEPLNPCSGAATWMKCSRTC